MGAGQYQRQELMKDDKQFLAETIDFAKGHAREIVESGEQHAPMVFALGQEGGPQVALVACDQGQPGLAILTFLSMSAIVAAERLAIDAIAKATW